MQDNKQELIHLLHSKGYTPEQIAQQTETSLSWVRTNLKFESVEERREFKRDEAACTKLRLDLEKLGLQCAGLTNEVMLQHLDELKQVVIAQDYEAGFKVIKRITSGGVKSLFEF